MTDLILTKKQKETYSNLKNNNFETIKQSDITRLLQKVLNNKEASTDLVPKVVEYEKQLHPGKDIKWIELYISKKIKDKSDRKMFKEVIKSDYSSLPDVVKPKSNKDNKVNEKISDFSSFDVSKAKNTKSGSDSELNKILESILGDKTKTETKTEPFKGPGRSITKNEIIQEPNTSIDLSGLFKTGTQTYKNNKELIDKFKASLTKEKIDDGSWLTSLASMEVPEIEILQSVINLTPLGLSTKDKDNLTNILSRDKNKMNSVSTSDGVKTILKTLINPDAVGQIISTRASQLSGDAAEGLDNWYRKATGQAPKKSEELGALEDVIKNRRLTEDKIATRKKELDELINGPKKVEPVVKPEDRIIGLRPGINNFPANKFKQVGEGYDVYNDPDATTHRMKIDKNQMTIEDILRPPNIPGLQVTSATDDFFSGLRSILVPSFGLGDKRTTKEGAIQYLKEKDPVKYAQYVKEVYNYDNLKKKLVLSGDSNIDMGMHKDAILRAYDMSKKLLKTATNLKMLSNSEIEQLYDVSSTLDDVLRGDSKITYKDLDQITNYFINKVPTKILADPDIKINDFIKNQVTELGQTFAGDSNLTKFKLDTDLTTELSDEDKQPDDEDKQPDDKDKQPDDKDKEPISETELDKKGSSASDRGDTGWSDYRPRLKVGGTDADFMRSNKNVNLGQLVSEMKGIDVPGWGNGADNILYKRNLMDNKIRYTNTTKLNYPKIKTSLEAELAQKQAEFNDNYLNGMHSFNNYHLTDQPAILKLDRDRKEIESNNIELSPYRQLGYVPKFGQMYENLNKPVWNSQHADAPYNRNFDKDMRGRDSFDQFLHFSPAYPQSSYNNTNRNNDYAYFPDERNKVAGRDELRAYKTSFLIQQRWNSNK